MTDTQDEHKDEAAAEGKCTPRELRSTVRFSEAEGRRLRRDRQLTGRSTPWLLKTTYFKGELKQPLFCDEQGREMLRLLGILANNHNQIARRNNAGLSDGTHEYMKQIALDIRALRAMASRDYGDR